MKNFCTFNRKFITYVTLGLLLMAAVFAAPTLPIRWNVVNAQEETPNESSTDSGAAYVIAGSPPTLGTYPNTSIRLGSNTTVTPGAAPTGTTSINVSAPTNFNGELTANPATGVVRVTNAALANIVPGTYPVTVRAFGPGGTTTGTFNLTVLSAPVCTELNFNPAVSFGLGPPPVSPLAIAVGDFNGDGKQDIATANFSSDNVSILVGNGAGSFAPVVNFAVGTIPRSVAVGDFNGDGNQDIATANDGSNNVSILVHNGADSFEPAVNFAAGLAPFSIAVGDFNGDGKQDIATANDGSSNVSILIGNGAGSFAPAVSFAVGLEPFSIAVGDFNGDGNQDIATANFISDNVSIIVGNGAGSFGPAVNFAVGNDPYSIAVGDFNGDGNQDIAAANASSNSVSILVGNGAGSFAPAVNFGVAVTPTSVVVGDFNGDGNQDIATVNYDSNNVSILTGNGAGSFAPAVNKVTGPNPQAVAVGDFNGDHYQDIATANPTTDTVSILKRSNCNMPPTISSNTISAPEGTVGNFTIATAADVNQAPNTLGITVNGGASATVNGVTVSGLSIAAGGAVTANVGAACGATAATFTLVVTDAQSATGGGTLTVNVTPNTPPTLSYAATQVAYGGAVVINPATGPADDGSVTSVVLQSQGTFAGTISVNNVTGVVSVGGATQSGSHTITVRVTDNCGAFFDAVFTLTVGNSPTNPVVTKTADTNDGLCMPTDCSLREALDAADGDNLGNIITFNIPANSAGCTGTNCTIVLTSPLAPAADAGVLTTIDGGTGANTVTLSGGAQFNHILSINNGANINVNNLNFTRGTANFNGGSITVSGGGALTLSNSALYGNANNNPGGALRCESGCTANLTNVTISGNSSPIGGGISNDGTVTATNCTITNNFGSFGGDGIRNNGTFNIRNTVIAGNNSVFTAQSDVFGVFASQGYNLIGKSDVANGFTQTGDQTGTVAGPLDARLAPLGNYGGKTLTHALLDGGANPSTAINTGTATGAPATDQRGAARVGVVDIGAFEVNNTANGGSFVAVLPVGSQIIPYLAQITANNGAFTYSVSSGTLPNGISLTTNVAPTAIVALSGTATQNGIFNFAITATNGANSNVTNYRVQILGPSSAGVSISGRVLTPAGSGLRNAIVQLTDPQGNTRTARTGSFGYYRFDDVEAGQTYVVGVALKRYVFAPRTVSVADELTDLDFNAQ